MLRHVCREVGNEVRNRAKIVFRNAILSLFPRVPYRTRIGPTLLFAILRWCDPPLCSAAERSLLTLGTGQVGLRGLWSQITSQLVPKGMRELRADVRAFAYGPHLAARTGAEEITPRLEFLGESVQRFAAGVSLAPYILAKWLSQLVVDDATNAEWHLETPVEDTWHRLFTVLEPIGPSNKSVFTPELVEFFRRTLRLVTPEDFFVALQVLGLDFKDINKDANEGEHYRVDQEICSVVVKHHEFFAGREDDRFFADITAALQCHERIDAVLLHLICERRGEHSIPPPLDLSSALDDPDADHRARLEVHRGRLSGTGAPNAMFAEIAPDLRAVAAAGHVYSLLDRSGRLRLALQAGMPARIIP